MELPPKSDNQTALIDFSILGDEANCAKLLFSGKYFPYDIKDTEGFTIFSVLARVLLGTHTGIWIEFKSDFIEKDKPEIVKLFIPDSRIKSIALLPERKIDSFDGKFPVGFRSQSQPPQT